MGFMLPERFGRKKPTTDAPYKRTAQLPAARESALYELQALAAAAKKKHPGTHDAVHLNPALPATTAEPEDVPPIETRPYRDAGNCGTATPQIAAPSGRTVTLCPTLTTMRIHVTRSGGPLAPPQRSVLATEGRPDAPHSHALAREALGAC